ncbi:MAG TPA: HAD family hydrolase [Chloroflexota bacterium]
MTTPHAPATTITTIAFDGDDTLWHNESIFSMTQERYRTLMRKYCAEEELDGQLLATEGRNLRLFGYGVKGFMLSMIETAIEVSDRQVSAADIQTIVDFGKAMLDHPVELLDGVRETVDALRERYRLLVITKGDLFDQESKLARSGLAELFWTVEIVSEKDEGTYRRILDAQDVEPGEFLMVGNSIRSDILPVVGIGASAVYVPYHLTWAHERAELGETPNGRFWTVRRIDELPGLLRRIAA